MSDALPPSGTVTLGVGLGFYSGPQLAMSEESVVERRSELVYSGNVGALPGGALSGLAFEAEDFTLIQDLVTHDQTDKLSVMLLSTMDPCSNSFNFPDIVETALPELKSKYHTATGETVSNCLTSYPRMQPHTYEEVFTKLVRLLAQRSTEWTEMGIPGTPDDLATFFRDQYIDGWTDACG